MRKRGGQGATAEVSLDLKNGSIHQLNPDPSSKDYMIIRFKKFTKRQPIVTELGKYHKAMTSGELKQAMVDPKTEDEFRRVAHRELIERRSISLASLIFALVGIPLAVKIRPSGKSWGILLAISLMLVYYILMKMGLTMVEHEKPLGVLMAFSPNLLFLALGAGLWWQTVRS
jgi:lipopolysaccharide export LptBFGC system permease protein LptF